MVAANYSYTERVGARAQLAAALLAAEHTERRRAAGLKDSDLELVRDQGNAAREADLAQAEQLATLTQTRSSRSVSANDVLAREDKLKAILPAVILDLQSSNPSEAAWLSAVSVARYRIRNTEVAAPDGAPTDAAAADARSVERVEREDKPARLQGAAKFARLILGAGHEAIVNELAERGMSREALTALAEDAGSMEQAGKNVLLPAEATAREKAAVKAQSVRWNAIRRMVAAACAGDGALSQRLSEC